MINRPILSNKVDLNISCVVKKVKRTVIMQPIENDREFDAKDCERLAAFFSKAAIWMKFK
jgi:hypothetical protein